MLGAVQHLRPIVPDVADSRVAGVSAHALGFVKNRTISPRAQTSCHWKQSLQDFAVAECRYLAGQAQACVNIRFRNTVSSGVHSLSALAIMHSLRPAPSPDDDPLSGTHRSAPPRCPFLDNFRVTDLYGRNPIEPIAATIPFAGRQPRFSYRWTDD